MKMCRDASCSSSSQSSSKKKKFTGLGMLHLHKVGFHAGTTYVANYKHKK